MEGRSILSCAFGGIQNGLLWLQCQTHTRGKDRGIHNVVNFLIITDLYGCLKPLFIVKLVSVFSVHTVARLFFLHKYNVSSYKGCGLLLILCWKCRFCLKRMNQHYAFWLPRHRRHKMADKSRTATVLCKQAAACLDICLLQHCVHLIQMSLTENTTQHTNKPD